MESFHPSIRHPITGQIIQIYSDEIQELLDQGFTEKQLLNIPREKYNEYLTGLSDVDYNIMLYLPFSELKKLCQTNKYAHKLCYNKEFWLEKIVYDDILLPTFVFKLVDVNWITVYEILKWINMYNAYVFSNSSNAFIINTNKLKKFNILLKKYNIDYIAGDDLKYISYYNINDNTYDLQFIILDDDELINDHQQNYNKKKFIQFLFEGFYNNLIIDLKKKFMVR